MLDCNPHIVQPSGQHQPRRYLSTISGQSIAKNHARHPRERAKLAAQWVEGLLVIKRPTVRQAANLFGAGEVSIRRETRQTTGTTARRRTPPLIDSAWAAAAPGDRERFARAHLADLWSLIDRLTR
jgi:hypothetical protein